MNPFIEGVLAGYGIAIPVGAVAVLIINTALRRGFWPGFFAGAGAASADLTFAALAVLAGQVLAGWLAPVQNVLGIAGGLVLVAIGGFGLLRALRPAAARSSDPESRGLLQTYAQFLGLTLLNPMTIAYFASLILGGGGRLDSAAARGLFVLGAGLASLSWQSLLAASGALGQKFLSPGLQRGVSILGSLIVIGLGARLIFF